MILAQRLALPAAWLAVIALFGVIEPDTFLTSANAQNILGSQAVLVVLTMARCSLSPPANTICRSRRY